MTIKAMLNEIYGEDVKTKANKELVTKVYGEYQRILANPQIVKSIDSWKNCTRYMILGDRR